MIAFENLKGFGAVLNLQSFLYDMILEHSGRVLDSRQRERVGASPVSLCCVLEKDTFILA